MKILMDWTSRFELQNGFVTGLMIDDLHCSVLLHPKLSNNDIVNGAVDIRPRVCFAPLWQRNRDETFRLYLNRFAPELQLRVNRAMKCEARRVGVKCWYRRMMRHLLAEAAKFRSLNLISFSKKRIEWLSQTIPVARESRDCKSCNVLDSIDRIGLLRSDSEKMRVLHILDHSLQEAQRLVKVNRHRYLTQFLSNTAFQYRHHIEFLLFEHRHRQNFPANKTVNQLVHETKVKH